MSCVIIFAKPLTAGGPDEVFTIVQEQLSPAVMEPLAKHGADYLSAEVVQSRTAEQVEIALAVPKAFGALDLSDGTAERLKELPVHSESDLERPLKSGAKISRTISGIPAEFEVYAWAGTKLVSPEQLRMLVRKL